MGNDCIVLNSTWQTKLSGLGQTSQYHKENVYLKLLVFVAFFPFNSNCCWEWLLWH